MGAFFAFGEILGRLADFLRRRVADVPLRVRVANVDATTLRYFVVFLRVAGILHVRIGLFVALRAGATVLRAAGISALCVAGSGALGGRGAALRFADIVTFSFANFVALSFASTTPSFADLLALGFADIAALGIRGIATFHFAGIGTLIIGRNATLQIAKVVLRIRSFVTLDSAADIATFVGICFGAVTFFRLAVIAVLADAGLGAGASSGANTLRRAVVFIRRAPTMTTYLFLDARILLGGRFFFLRARIFCRDGVAT